MKFLPNRLTFLFFYRDSRRKLSCLRHWSRDSMADDEVLSADEKSLIEQIIKEVGEFEGVFILSSFIIIIF